MSMPLAAALTAASDSGLKRRIATVKTTSPLVVTTATGVDLKATGRLASYTPTVGHVVMLAVDDAGAAVILGRLVYP